MASTSSTSTPPRKIEHDVFLSFRGEDTRKNFIDHLYNQLVQKGICTFKDDEGLGKGQQIAKLLQIIKESRFAIVVFSKDYASSTWCLEEIATIMECQEQYGEEIVIPIFYDVEPTDVRHQKGSFAKSFAEHEKNFKDDKAKVERWRDALRNACRLSGHNLKTEYNGFEGKCVERVTNQIFTLLNQSIQASTVLQNNFVGLESRVGYVGNLLTLEPDDVQFIGIWGMGGIGKTTTAMAVFNKFLTRFDGACYLANIRQHKIIELQTTLLETIQNEKMEISNEIDGMEKIQRWLGRKKVLIVLDDVDQVEQLQNLAGDYNWFGRGSRVIITTRDASVLRSHVVNEKYIYEVETLGEEEAIQLFSLFAFKKEAAPGVKQLSGLIVRYAMGLPLVLKVLGSYLCGLKADSWENILVKLKDSDSDHKPKDKILKVLRISFDGLDAENRNVFLHIACFLRNWREEFVRNVVDNNLVVLIEKSLISVQNGKIEMHDRIQEMGHHIASKEDPRKMVWQLKDVGDVLSGKLEQIEGIELPDPWPEPRENITFEITLRGMRTLKILKVHSSIVFRISDKYLPISLRWLEFESYHFDSLPESFASPKLFCLSLRKSSLQNCRITQRLHKLTHLDLSFSESLLETPDFDLMPNLITLNLVGCFNLKVVHPSIGNLRKLVSLRLSVCNNLEELPCFNQVSCLEDLDLENCSKLNNFPEIREIIPHLVELELREVGIIELHSSIQQLQGLTKLYLDDCEHLVGLSSGFCELKNLKVVMINDCTNLKSLPENLQSLISLEYLNLNGSHIDSLPESFNQLPCLQYLDIRNCVNLKELPAELPETTCELYADSCFSYRGHIDELADFPKLQSVAFSSSDEVVRSVYNFAKMCIHFPSHRKTPFSVTYPIYSSEDWDEVPYYEVNVLRIFQYRCYKSNGIAIDLNPDWYCQGFVGFVVFFLTGLNTWGFHSYNDIVDVEHCTIIVKLSCKDNRNEVLERKCAIVRSSSNGYPESSGSICSAYIPISCLWPAKSNSVTSNDFSRFEVNFMDSKATANWGCSLLYRRRITPTSWDETCEGSTTDIGPLGMLEYLNLSGKKFEHLPEDISLLPRLQYLDISGCKRLRRLPELSPTIRELYANSYLASENNIVELATEYPELYSVSFSEPIDDDDPAPALVPGELAKKFIPITEPFLNRNTPFVVTHPLYSYLGYNISRCFMYHHHDPHKISISLDPTWYDHSFVGFVVCFVFPIEVRWESQPNIRPFMHCELIAKLKHKGNGSEPPLETKCVIGRLYDEKFDYSVEELVCFAYIPFSSLWPKSKAIMDNSTPNHYLVFEAAIQDLEISRTFWLPQSITDDATPYWSCGLLYTDDESLTEAIRKKREAGSSESDLGPNETKLWESTAIVDRDQCRMVSMPECSDAKVARLLYTNSGVSILALSLDGIQKLWKWPNNEQNPTGKATANSVPQHWQPNSGLLMINDVEGVNLEKVVPCIALSNDGSYIVSATGGKVSLFNIMTFKVTKLITLPSAPTFLAFNPYDDNIIVIGTEKSTIYIYDRLDDDEEFNELEEHQKPITGLAFSTNLKLLVSSDADAQLCSWNTRLWKKKRSVRIQLPAGEVCSGDTHVMFHVDQLHLLVTHETQLAIYDASKMERINQWIPHGSLSAPISSATYSCNCELIYVSFKDGNIGVFDAHKLRLRCRIAPSAYLSQAVLNRNEGVYAVVIAAHPQEPNQLALGLIDGSVKVIEPLESGGEWGISLPMGHRTKLWEFTKIVDQVQCQVIFMTECSDVKVARLLYTNPGGILALRSNGIQKLWKWPNNEQNPTGKATANSAPEHWQPNSGLMINDVDVNPEEVVSCIDLSKNDSYIVSAAGKKVSLLDIMTFEVLTTFNPPSTPTFLVFCPCDNNIIAIGMEDATIIIYNVRLNKVKIRLIRGHHEPITCLAFSTTCPNMLVSSSADAQLCVWNIVGRRQNRRLVCIRSPDGKVHSGDTHVMFHTDQLHVLLVTRETQLAIYDTSNLERKRQWIPQGCLSTKISSATYSCNSQLVYASFTDGNIGVLDADNLTLRCCIVPSAYLSQPLMNSEDVVHAVVIAAHPQKPNQLAIGLTDGSIKVIEPLEYEGEWGISPPIDIEILNGTGEAEQREPNLANEDCEPEEISARTQVELGTGEAEQSEPNPTNEDCEPEEISVRTQIELGTVEVEQVEPNPANEDCEAAKKSVLTQLEQGTGEAEQTEPNPTNEDCELEERSVVTQPELGTGEAEQSEPNPANEDCEAKVHSNKCALIRCFWKCC